MPKGNMPAATAHVRPGLRSDISPSALSRWNPDISFATDSSEPTISILEPIGADLDGGGVTQKRIDAALRAIGENDVTVTINSPGGDFFEGLGIYNSLREHKGKVTVKVLGLAASAASAIAMAADELQVARAGFLMIHNTWVIAVGNRHKFREVADWLEPFDRAGAELYAARSGLSVEEVAELLDRESYMGGVEAVEKGFADSLLPSDEVQNAVTQGEGPSLSASIRKLEMILRRDNFSTSEAKAFVSELKQSMRDAAQGDTRDAVVTGTRDAAVKALAHDALAKLEKL